MAAIVGPLFHALVESARPRIGLLDVCRISLRVMPWDCDINLHLNNSRYLEAMDAGRYALVGRTGMLSHAIRDGWRPVVASARVRYRRSLLPFERYELATRITGWDDDYFFIEQRFETRDRNGTVHVAATGYIRGVFLGRDGKRVSPQVIAQRVQPELTETPPVDEHLRLWLEADDLIRERRNRPEANSRR